jgi:uncharacterized coiled-coil DUF342 family protein
MMILEAAVQDPTAAEKWILSAIAVVSLLIAFWNKLRGLLDNISEWITNKLHMRVESAERDKIQQQLVEKQEVIANKMEALVKQMDKVNTDYRIGIEKMTAIKEAAEREHESIVTLQEDVKEMQQQLAELKGRLSK